MDAAGRRSTGTQVRGMSPATVIDSLPIDLLRAKCRHLIGCNGYIAVLFTQCFLNLYIYATTQMFRRPCPRILVKLPKSTMPQQPAG